LYPKAVTSKHEASKRRLGTIAKENEQIEMYEREVIHFISGGRKSILLLGSQAMPTRPSDKDRMRVQLI
jgi:hypothetical protein